MWKGPQGITRLPQIPHYVISAKLRARLISMKVRTGDREKLVNVFGEEVVPTVEKLRSTKRFAETCEL